MINDTIHNIIQRKLFDLFFVRWHVVTYIYDMVKDGHGQE